MVTLTTNFERTATGFGEAIESLRPDRQWLRSVVVEGGRLSATFDEEEGNGYTVEYR